MRGISLCLLILTFLALGAESNTPRLSRYRCSNSNTTSTSFKADRDLVLHSLSSNSKTQTGYSNTSSGAVYGSILCRGDLNPDACEECVVNATEMAVRLCHGSEWAILWFDQCMLRYSDHNFFSSMEREPSLDEYNKEPVVGPEQFMAVLEKTMGQLVNKLGAKYSRVKKYVTKDVKINAKQTLYTMAQCTPDINKTGCMNCLETADHKLQTIDKEKIGGRVLLPSCFVRFEIYEFYGINSKGTKEFSTTVVLVIAAAVAFMMTCLMGCLLMQRKGRKAKDHIEEDPIVGTGISELHALQFPLCSIEAATNSFSSNNKLGEGGFGPVYKGKLPCGSEIAAKRLSQASGQGVQEFENEIELVAKLQHRNLVRLLGFSLEREETILIYEYVPKGSLDHSLFDPKISGILDWSRRYKITVGVARGLLYLHEDSRLRIIHRDLKASNILLDAEMNAKISDFGMARIFGADQIEASTNRIVGTYGYMSPEYIMFGHFSTKSDVFSFGVLVLEIITGKKNSGFHPQNFDEGLLGYVWKHWSEGIPLKLVDPALGNSYSANEVIRCIHIGLLCVQDDPDDRPTVDSVIRMLNSESTSLPLPQRPSFFFPSRKHKQPLPNSNLEQATENEALHTELVPR
ncbi:putative receptor-like protein kinase At4g00960 [Punica granatum]|uniref:Receptor-like protein kinase At4g00960 n=1 Tax=Punica granatum TaxID=22663 RepID=A0A218WZ96_PUNGR|nr:putative receptor-like protein kinase At4g00960 [Punica granatum]OWM77680.1 hypothetical protein CDL15_Pgr017080 [Punica granatum]